MGEDRRREQTCQLRYSPLAFLRRLSRLCLRYPPGIARSVRRAPADPAFLFLIVCFNNPQPRATVSAVVSASTGSGVSSSSIWICGVISSPAPLTMAASDYVDRPDAAGLTLFFVLGKFAEKLSRQTVNWFHGARYPGSTSLPCSRAAAPLHALHFPWLSRVPAHRGYTGENLTQIMVRVKFVFVINTTSAMINPPLR